MSAVAAALAINFGDLGMYSGGAFVPDGDYVLNFNVIMHQAKDKAGVAKGPIRLGVQVDFLPLTNPVEEAKLTQFYSLGSKADQFFAPNPETGKGLVAIPGASGGNLNDKTNWAMLLKSLYDSGLPAGVFTNDVTPLDGVHVHISNVDEPSERSGFASATAEVAQDRKPGKIAIVTEILENGAPWEGGGGIPEVAAAPVKAPAKPGPKPVPAKVTPKVTPKPTPPAVPAAAGEDEAVREAASAAIAEVIMKKPNGLPRLALRTETFTAATKANGAEVASAIISQFFEPGTEEALGLVLAELGYSVQGAQVKPAVTA